MQKTNQSPETTRESVAARNLGGIRARERSLGEPKWGEYRKGCALSHCIGALRRAGLARAVSADSGPWGGEWGCLEVVQGRSERGPVGCAQRTVAEAAGTAAWINPSAIW